MKEYSERVPNKNLRKLSGKPLFFHILESLSKSKHVKDIFIDTASRKIADLAKANFDVNIINRAPHLLDNTVTGNQFIEHDIRLIDNEYFMFTHATNPLLTSKTIDKAIEVFFQGMQDGYDSLFSVERIQKRVYTKDGNPINHNMGRELKMTQDLDPIFVETSSFFIFSRKMFDENKRRVGNNPFLFEMNCYEAIDIDYVSDFYVAEAIVLNNRDGRIY